MLYCCQHITRTVTALEHSAYGKTSSLKQIPWSLSVMVPKSFSQTKSIPAGAPGQWTGLKWPEALTTVLCLPSGHLGGILQRRLSNRHGKQRVYLLTNFPWSAAVSWLTLQDRRQGTHVTWCSQTLSTTQFFVHP